MSIKQSACWKEKKELTASVQVLFGDSNGDLKELIVDQQCADCVWWSVEVNDTERWVRQFQVGGTQLYKHYIAAWYLHNSIIK